MSCIFGNWIEEIALENDKLQCNDNKYISVTTKINNKKDFIGKYSWERTQKFVR